MEKKSQAERDESRYEERIEDCLRKLEAKVTEILEKKKEGELEFAKVSDVVSFFVRDVVPSLTEIELEDIVCDLARTTEGIPDYRFRAGKRIMRIPLIRRSITNSNFENHHQIRAEVGEEVLKVFLLDYEMPEW